MLSGVGYKDTFTDRLYGHPDIGLIRIHLLTLQDLFEKTEAFYNALKDLPPLEKLEGIVKSQDKTTMLFGSAKDMVAKLVSEVKQLQVNFRGVVC